jgi:hypothetical protein
MPAELSSDERLVRDWLCERGYEPEYEPAIVKSGRQPDFLATATTRAATPNIFWAEVKSLQPDNTALALSKAWPILKKLGVPDKVNGHAMLHVTEATSEQSVRALVRMFYGKAIAHAWETVRLIFVQQCSAKTNIRYFEVQGPTVQKVWARGGSNGKIAVPDSTVENTQAMVTWEQDGKSQTQPAFKVFDWALPFDCALVVNIDPSDRPLTSISSMSSGSSNIPTRTLSALEAANSQLRNAHGFRAAPGVVFVVPSEEHVDDQMIAMGSYGKLTASMSRETGKLGEAFYGRDGAFRRDKNTHISAAIRLRRNGETATYFPNPFAKEPIDENASLFSGLHRAPVQFE